MCTELSNMSSVLNEDMKKKGFNVQFSIIELQKYDDEC